VGTLELGMPRHLAEFLFLLIAFPQLTFSQQGAGSDVTPLLLPGLGTRHHPISTKNPEAQKYFDQGLMLVFDFNRAEAVRSFRRAAQLDPEAAMPHWGMALAYGRHMNMDFDMDVQPSKAYAAIQDAILLSGKASEKEQLYIRALAQRCSKDETVDWPKVDAAYASAMGNLAERYADDLDAAALHLEAKMMLHRYEWFHDNMAEEGTSDAIRQIEDVLRRDPDHPLANHLYIHILDTGHPELALGSAYRLGQVAPGLGHLVHMPSHIFFNLGDYEMAARVNEQAAAADREYMELANPGYTPYTLLYYMHDIHFVSRARAEQGLFAEAKRTADQVVDRVRPVQDAWPMVADYYLAVPFLVSLRFQKWDDVLTTPEPDPKMVVSNAMWHYARTLALAGEGQRQQALAQKAVFEQVRRKMPANTMWMLSSGASLLGLASLVLDARLAEDPERAIEIWRKAVKAQDALAYDEPPPWYYPVRESLGAELLRAGKAADAETVFRECLSRNPRDPRALFGLVETLKAEKKMDAAESVQHEFRSSWKNPDLQPHLEAF
jgi:tetratricopeptide (TPR) repeat protein